MGYERKEKERVRLLVKFCFSTFYFFCFHRLKDTNGSIGETCVISLSTYSSRKCSFMSLERRKKRSSMHGRREPAILLPQHIALLRRGDFSSNKRNQGGANARPVLCNTYPNALLALGTDLGNGTQSLADVLLKVGIELD